MNTEEPINDGGPAFPLGPTAGTMKPHPDGGMVVTHYGMEQGMPLRDYFAASEKLGDIDSMNDDSALLIIGSALGGPKPQGSWSDDPVGWIKWNARWRSELRYIRADAMLKARVSK